MSANSQVLELIARNQEYAKTHTPSPFIEELPVSVRPHVIIYCCLDGRVDPAALLGLTPSDAFVLRNIGCGVSRNINDMLFLDSVLDLREVLILSHTDCGVTHVTDDAIRKTIKSRITGQDKEIDGLHFGTFKDNFERVRSDVKFFKTHPLVRQELAENIFGAVYDIKTGKVTRVEI
ncbi:carbonic anhydrase [Hypoxylon fuscum]|nr:carbonic anhydrase [Hypoxylon fuscum]